MSRLIVIDHGFNVGKVFSELFDEVINIHRYELPALKEGDVIVFEGGTDINPSLYDEFPGSYTQKPDYRRDAFEVMVATKAKAMGLGMLGICRGAQLLCALSGGKLIQHVNNHGRDHKVVDHKGRDYWVTSSHHQMMFPNNVPHTLLAWCHEAGFHLGEEDKRVDTEQDPEVVWFPETKSLCIQGHPEWMSPNEKGTIIFKEYVKEFLK